VVRFLVVIALAACGPKPSSETPSNAARDGGSIVLYRDHAIVTHRIELVFPPNGDLHVKLKIAAGIKASDLVVLEREHYEVKELHVPEDPPLPPPVPDEDEDPAEPPATPKEIELVLAARAAGRHAIHVAYVTDRLSWEAAYTMTTTPARDRAILRGAIAIRNAMGIPLHGVTVLVVDAELGPSSRRAAETISASYAGTEPATTPTATPRDLGSLEIVDGETRVELLPDARPRPMRSVLVFDPVGTDLDRASAHPVRDRALGGSVSSTRVTESFEVSRDVAATRGLPGGPVRLLERRADGTLAVLGESRLFDASMRIAETDTIPVGTAEGVTGRRERREYTYDEPHKRLAEDFVLTIDNARTRPVEVIVREHLYRGQNWTLAYRSSPVAAKEGPQQISMRMIVPPKGQGQLLYVVVYTWP
jgi:hypothetical protein